MKFLLNYNLEVSGWARALLHKNWHMSRLLEVMPGFSFLRMVRVWYTSGKSIKGNTWWYPSSLLCYHSKIFSVSTQEYTSPIPELSLPVGLFGQSILADKKMETWDVTVFWTYLSWFYFMKIYDCLLHSNEWVTGPPKNRLAKIQICSLSNIPLNLGFPLWSVSLVGLELKSVELPKSRR